MSAAGVRAFIAAPLHHEETDFGAFVSWFHHERTFDDEAAPLAEALAGQAAQALATLRLQAQLAHAATHDQVTGLPNRRLLETQMDEIVGASRCAVLFIDLDGFKRVNDRLGHQAGDRMLCEVGTAAADGVRAGDLVARYGGDEFVIVCEISDAPKPSKSASGSSTCFAATQRTPPPSDIEREYRSRDRPRGQRTPRRAAYPPGRPGDVRRKDRRRKQDRPRQGLTPREHPVADDPSAGMHSSPRMP